MNVKSCEKQGSTATLVLEVEKARFDAALETAYRKNRGQINVPGFRRGKAPRKVIEAMYGTTIFYEEAVNELFPEAYSEAITQTGLKAVGYPSVDTLNFAENGDLELTIKTDVYPEVTLGDYKGIEVSKLDVEVTDEEVDAEIDRLVQRNARVQTVERPAQTGDTVKLDFDGYVDGKPFDGGKGENYDLTLGSGQFIPGFEDQLVGLSAGESKDVVVTFPEDYGAKELAGKEATFKCTVHSVEETILPEKDDEFAKDVSEFDTFAELVADTRRSLTESRQKDVDNAFSAACVSAAAANITADIPESMIEMMEDNLVNNYRSQVQMMGMKFEQYLQMMGVDEAGFKKNLRPEAESRVRSDLLLEKVAEVEGLTVTDEELEAEYATLAENYKMEVEKVKEAISAEDLRTDRLYAKASKLITDAAIPTKFESEKPEEAPAESASEKPKRTRKKKTEEAPAEEAPKAEE